MLPVHVILMFFRCSFGVIFVFLTSTRRKRTSYSHYWQYRCLLQHRIAVIKIGIATAMTDFEAPPPGYAVLWSVGVGAAIAPVASRCPSRFITSIVVMDAASFLPGWPGCIVPLWTCHVKLGQLPNWIWITSKIRILGLLVFSVQIQFLIYIPQESWSLVQVRF